ncbi:YceI family protein [Hymenobacter sp. RP-2-7]|uniref:YceI family protein n=1 Tax=Hymenobacter polaris TaxID=2682546 RepID=A0A7Y0AHQ7_9BACT|nr:YceI family protein [Hymenobacter polaris]NML67397.1 YceI family protein [Hymenobacter polaris]
MVSSLRAGRRWGPLLRGLLAWLGGLALPHAGLAQSKFMTKAGHLTFFSASIMEDIEARNDKVAAVFDLSGGQVAFAVPIREFQFKRTLMQEHFNENYLESEKYPRATFTGQVLDAAQVLKLLPTGTQNVEVEGNLTMHGVTRKIVVAGTIQQRDAQVILVAYFNLAPADYAIDVPLLVREHIAKSVSVRLNVTCDLVSPALTQQP